ncbi:MAG: iron ABC transporter permease [Pseudomonadota bacterium]
MARSFFIVTAWCFAALCILPIVALIVSASAGSWETWTSLANTVLPGFAWTTLVLVFYVAVGTAVVGAVTAWLVTAYTFPGRRILEILLALPLAFPAYVIAYAYTDLLDHPGAVQTALRSIMDWGPRDYWFPEIRSVGGAALMLIFVLYPYVYLLTRAAFLRQSSTAFQAARMLGHSSWSAFFRVSLPTARPAIAGGVILALMETVADFGTVAHFGVQTFATGIYQAWISIGDRPAAAQLAFCLLQVALLLVVLERLERRAQRHYDIGRPADVMQPVRLRGPQAIMALIACILPVLVGFVIPLIVLFEMAIGSGQSPFSRRYLAFAANSLTAAGIAALVTMVGAVAVGYLARLVPGRIPIALKAVAGMGYAIPGGVIAVSLLIPLAAFDNAVDAVMRDWFGISTGLLLTGSIVLLVMAYTVRFMAVGLAAFDTGMSSINPAMDAAARTLGARPGRMFLRVHLPLLRTGLLTGFLIVFVDVMKELPATLILRPFNFDTLAVQAYRLASDERLAQAAVPSLVIVAFGLLPVIILCHSIVRSRSGEASRALSTAPAGATRAVASQRRPLPGESVS